MGEGIAGRVLGRIGQDAGLKRLAEEGFQRGETLGLAGGIAVKAQRHDLQILAALKRFGLVRLEVKGGGVVEGQGRFSRDGRRHAGLDSDRPGEIARQAKPDGRDAGTAALVMDMARQRAQPVADRTAAVLREQADLPGHAGPRHAADPAVDLVQLLQRRARPVIERRRVDAKSGRLDPARQAPELADEAGQFMHQDHARPLARHQHRMGGAAGFKIEAFGKGRAVVAGQDVGEGAGHGGLGANKRGRLRY